MKIGVFNRINFAISNFQLLIFNFLFSRPAMLLSMTGQGEGRSEQNGVTVAIELRTVNNRYLKLHLRGGEGYASLEKHIEHAIKEKVKRGTINVSLRIHRKSSADDYRLNQVVLGSYVDQLAAINNDPPSLDLLLQLPGVVEENLDSRGDNEKQWPVVQQALAIALAELTKMRSEEGAAMLVDLTENCETIRLELGEVEKLAPGVADSYRERLTDRVRQSLEKHDIEVDPSAVLREVALFAERCDISEEIVRLRTHVDQFLEIMNGDEESNGRKLEFLTQEMFRETNTIGSKANNADIARRVIEIKAAIEKMREMIQNVE